MRLLRALFRGGAVQIGALDPRLSAAAIAEKARAPRSTVQARLAQWRESGFFPRSDVWPSPALFGANTGGIGLMVPDARAKPGVLRDLALVDGILGSLDHLGPFVALQVADESPASRERRLALLAKLPGVERVRPLGFTSIPAPDPPTPLQWRIIEALRAEPDAPLAVLADKVSVSVRTFARHYGELVETRRVWFVPLLDFSRFPGVVAKIHVEPAEPARRRAILDELMRQFPEGVQHTHEHGPPPVPGAPIELFLQFENAAAVDAAIKTMLGVEGVRNVEASFPLRFASIGSWFDERLAARPAR